MYKKKVFKWHCLIIIMERRDKNMTKINENTLMVISSDKMGEGEEEIGKILMKNFMYALTEAEDIPSTIIFYNGGAKLVSKDSLVIEELKKLEELGVEILTCGTCLNYYNLTEELAVGKITNMYTIVEKMSASKKIIKP
ncbi:MAG: sulfurtransferase-like selenium metabolism protein YedF [Clostridium thermopalmarium]|nr:sulfurtransferase-like selenium metabolism protein YedF [Clostridium thermopalmarium]